MGGSLVGGGVSYAATDKACVVCRVGRGGDGLYRLGDGGAASGQLRTLWQIWGGGAASGQPRTLW